MSQATESDPAYVDLQVNGYAGVDFNADDLTVDAVGAACEQMRRDGVAAALATVVTDTPDRMTARLANLARAHAEDDGVADVIWGIHIEGPFLNPSAGTAGAHPRDAICPPDIDLMERLLGAAGGLTRLVTLAPECDMDLGLTRFLDRRGVVVSAGHCDPTRDQLAAAIDAGLGMFTHVGNGCGLNIGRHDNIIQRALSLSDRLWCCFIADGVHIPPFALGNYLKAAGIDRSIVVTDAMTAAGLGPGRYKIGSIDVEVDGQHAARLADGDGRLAGSVATMPFLENVLSKDVGLCEADIRKLLIDNPRQAIGMPDA